jgi:hypothetical protein
MDPWAGSDSLSGYVCAACPEIKAQFHSSLDEQAKSDPESAVFVILTLGLLLGLQPLATDLYLPALPQLCKALRPYLAGPADTDRLLLAFGCSQILWGPLSDRLGRRPSCCWASAAM